MIKFTRHPLVFLALILSLVIFVMPTHADLMFSAITGRKPLVMAVVTLICFGRVLIPLITGSVLTCRHPERWRKSKLSVATWVILGVAVLVNGFGWVYACETEYLLIGGYVVGYHGYPRATA